MLHLFGAPRTRASRVMWMLEELDEPYEWTPGFLPEGGLPLGVATSDLAHANPNAKVPVLVDGEVTLSESLAINLYLASTRETDLHPTTLAGRAQAVQWRLWAVTEIEPGITAIQTFRRDVGLENASPSERAALEAHEVALQRPFSVLDSVFRDASFLVEDRFTVADLNVAAVLAVAIPAEIDLSGHPNLLAWFGRCLARPAAGAVFQRAMQDAEEHWGAGATQPI